MKRAVMTLGVLAILLGLSLTSAQAALIDGFESPPIPNLFSGDMNAGITYWNGVAPEAGITEGVQNLGMYIPATGWIQLGAEWDWPLAQTIKDNDLLKFDITIPAGSGTGSDWANLNAVMMGDGLGWTQQYIPEVVVGVNGATATWDYRSLKSAWGTGTSWWYVGLYMGSGEGRVVYIDNIRAETVPEPSTIILLAMGGLALLVWRRR